MINVSLMPTFISYSSGLQHTYDVVMFPPPCLLSMLPRLRANRSRQRTPAGPENLSPAGGKCRVRAAGASFHMAGTQTTQMICHHAVHLSHPSAAAVWSSRLPLGQVTLVVVPWRVLWNQRDDLEFYPLTPVWKIHLRRGFSHMIGFFLSFLKINQTIVKTKNF